MPTSNTTNAAATKKKNWAPASVPTSQPMAKIAT
ncbi:Uncharacterised protein [Mycobacterium tuberculosis]|uniref:Uncharacterized protein n=1 Tax=Mycobacterium tuberculosis TaxID=1773 RepID=A0A916L9L7_MYCTX|nr:Uncharacterised protein [Mycobacterium tuberculosis]COX89173.1 Uncharacterised protein [Mycobacterium tuberculosis]